MTAPASIFEETKFGPIPHPSGDRMVFLVPSERAPQISYRVDLLANDGAGWCQCMDFATRRQLAIEAGRVRWTSQTTCKHLRSAARYFLADLLRTMSERENGILAGTK